MHELTARVLFRAQLLPVAAKPRDWSALAGEDAPAFRILVLLGHVMPDREVFGVRGNPILAVAARRLAEIGVASDIQ
jgi:hypothetical protein